MHTNCDSVLKWALSKLLIKELKAVVVLAPFSSLVGMDDCTLCVRLSSIAILISFHPNSWKSGQSFSSSLVQPWFAKLKIIIIKKNELTLKNPRTKRTLDQNVFLKGSNYFFLLILQTPQKEPFPPPACPGAPCSDGDCPGPLSLSSSPSPLLLCVQFSSNLLPMPCTSLHGAMEMHCSTSLGESSPSFEVVQTQADLPNAFWHGGPIRSYK